MLVLRTNNFWIQLPFPLWKIRKGRGEGVDWVYIRNKEKRNPHHRSIIELGTWLSFPTLSATYLSFIPCPFFFFLTLLSTRRNQVIWRYVRFAIRSLKPTCFSLHQEPGNNWSRKEGTKEDRKYACNLVMLQKDMYAIDSLADKSDEPNCKTINHIETWRGSPFSALMLMFYFVLREKWMKNKETNLIKYIPLLYI